MTQSVRHPVADNVRAEMARRRLRQADVCAALNLGRTALHRRLIGEVTFDVDEINALAVLFGVEPAVLLETNDQPAMTGT